MLYRSPYPDAWIPEVPLADFVLHSASSHPDKAALIDGATRRTVTYRQLGENVRRAAAGLAARGVKQRDVVALCGPNSPEYVAAFYAVTSLGAIVTTLNPMYNVAELSHQLHDSRPSVLLKVGMPAESALRAAERAKIPIKIAFDDLAADERVEVPPATIRPKEDIAAVIYSNGTADVPMGVMLTHFNLVANLVQTKIVEPIGESEVLVGMMPFCQMYAMVAVNIALHAGATIVTLPQFNITLLLDVMDRYKVTTAYMVPPTIRILARHPSVARHDLSALRHIISLTAPLPETVGKACAERLRCTMRQAYGLTEAVAFTHFTPRDHARIATMGQAVPNTEFRIVDVASRQDVHAGRLGEILVRGPQVMRGYWNFPEVTEHIIDADGWLHTCDLGYADSDGNLSVVDRSKKLVRLRGLHREDDEMLRAAIDDIAARREAAERARFQSVLLDSVHESVLSTDLKNQVTFWNKGAEHLFGYPAAEAIGKPVTSLIFPSDETIVRPDKTDALRSRGTWNAQVVRRRKDGSELWTDLTVSIVKNVDNERSGFVGIHRDITEQRRVEQRLRFQAQLLDSVRESVVATDLDGRIVFWGRGAEALFGSSAAEMLGQPLALLTFDNDPAGQFSRVRGEVLRRGVWSARSVRCRRAASEFWADIVVAPVKDAEGAPVGLVAVHRDVTELRQNQELLKDSHLRLRNLAARLMVVREHERSSIARELHDELGQALTRLNMDLCSLTEKLPKRLQTSRFTSMVPLVDKMLKTVQHISSELRPSILDDLGLEAAIEWHAHEFAEWSGCHCALDLRIGMLPRDRDRDITVFRILQEALTNVARHARAAHVTIRAWTAGSEFLLEVTDDGIGIPDTKLSSPQSLGIIGMRERAEGLGGVIIFASDAKRGSTITLRLPSIEAALREPAAS